MVRSYKTVDELIPELERMIAKFKAEGASVLPPERRLADETGSSVMTLRKALSALERRGVFVKHDRVRIIAGTTHGSGTPRKTAVAFVASGCTYPGNIQWLRLSFNLGERLGEAGLEFRTVCLNREDNRKTLERRLGNDVGLVIFADAPTPQIRCDVLSLRDRMPVICVDEDAVGNSDCLVSLNNYQAGRLAAKKLIEAGCRHPAVNFADKGYLPFYLRRNGFLDELTERGFSTEACAYASRSPWEPIPGETLLPDLIEHICRDGHDGLFLFTDGESQAVRQFLRKSYRIPETFKLITLDAQGECRQPDSMISAVSHATTEVAKRLFEIIVKYSRGENFEKINLLDATYLPGETA